MLTKEYYTLQTSLERRNTELETVVQEYKAKLETYEKLEMELDEVVMQAADRKYTCICQQPEKKKTLKRSDFSCQNRHLLAINNTSVGFESTPLG